MKPRLGVITAVAASAIALASAVVMGVLLASLSAPAGYGARLAALEQQTDEAKRLDRPLRASDAPTIDAVCGKPAAEQSEAMRASLASAAAALGLSVTRLEVAPQAPLGASRSLTPIAVRIDASGPYEGALGLLAQIDKASPQVFADSLDLASKTSTVTLSFTGRAFCAA